MKFYKKFENLKSKGKKKKRISKNKLDMVMNINSQHVDPHLIEYKDIAPIPKDLICANLLQNTENQPTKLTCYNLLIELYKKF